jgi:hypothetical protein
MDRVELGAFVQKGKETGEFVLNKFIFPEIWREVVIKAVAFSPVQWEHNNDESFKTNEHITPKRFFSETE